MIPTLILSAALLTGAPEATAAQPSTSLARATVDGFTELAAEFDAAVTAWRAQIESTEDRAARTELRRNHPAKAFLARFEALSNDGDGQATLWLASNVKDLGVPASKRGPIVTGHFEALFAQHLEAPWFGDAVAALMREGKVEDAVKQRLLRRAVDGAQAAGTRAPAMFALGQMLYTGDGEEKAEGKRLLDAVAAEYAKTPWGTAAKAMFITEEDLAVGKVAPDFYGQTIDGFGFNLSDYRGKVVLVDFYGFW